jgi:predicted nucleic acid-binding protein
MTFVDTGYLLALCEDRDALHLRAVAWSAFITGPVVTTAYVLLETVNALSNEPARPKVHGLLHHIRSSSGYEIVSAEDALFEAGLRLHKQRTYKNWSLTDCISFLVMNERGVKDALTHDHHFEQAGYNALLRRDPP